MTIILTKAITWYMQIYKEEKIDLNVVYIRIIKSKVKLVNMNEYNSVNKLPQRIVYY